MPLRKLVEDCTDQDTLQKNWDETLDTVDASAKTIEGLKADLVSRDAIIKEQGDNLAAVEAKSHEEKCDQLIAIRKELGRKAALETDETKVKEYRDSIIGKSPEYVADALSDETELVAEQRAAADKEKLEDPTGDSSNSETDADKKKKENDKQNADKGDKETTDSEADFDMNQFC